MEESSNWKIPEYDLNYKLSSLPPITQFSEYNTKSKRKENLYVRDLLTCQIYYPWFINSSTISKNMKKFFNSNPHVITISHSFITQRQNNEIVIQRRKILPNIQKDENAIKIHRQIFWIHTNQKSLFWHSKNSDQNPQLKSQQLYLSNKLSLFKDTKLRDQNPIHPAKSDPSSLIPMKLPMCIV